MLRFIRIAALSIGSILPVAPLTAQTTPAPPDWQDGQAPSVYTSPSQLPVAQHSTETDRYSAARSRDDAVAPALHTTPPPTNEPAGRRLAPPSNRDMLTSDGRSPSTSSVRSMPSLGLPIQSMYTVGTALAIVIGAFLIFAWALRKGSKNARGRRQIVPAEAVRVLGHVSLAGRQSAELLRVGNKLVLVAMTPGGPATITEVTDPAEVDRLTGLCQQFSPHSTTKAFEQVFQQFSSEPAGDTFIGGEPLPLSLSAAATAYRSQRGTARV